MKKLLTIVIVLCACARGFGAVFCDTGTCTLNYTSPSDLSSAIDPGNQVQQQFGVTKAAFLALHSQVITFSGSAGAGANLPKAVVATYSGSETVRFDFAAPYNFGGLTSAGRTAFSGPNAWDDISTVETQPNNCWFDVPKVTVSAPGKGVTAIGFCVCGRNNAISGPGQALFTLSDGQTGSYDYPSFGGGQSLQKLFIGFQAPPGLSITSFRCTRPSEGNSYVAIDDLAFVVSTITLETNPSSVADLAAVSTSETTATLTWTAPGGHGTVGTASGYYVRYSTQPITDANWAGATPVGNVPAPQASGTPETLVVTGLTLDTVYYFAIKAWNDTQNVSDLSNVASVKTLDLTPPAAVTDLVAGSATRDSLLLTWTAPGDNGASGTARSYDIRYSTDPITDANWDSAVPVNDVAGKTVPKASGTVQSKTVKGLAAGTRYYFALKASDEVPNVSALSNIASGTTSASSSSNALDRPVIRQEDFEYLGAFALPKFACGDSTASAESGLAIRHVNGQLRLLTGSSRQSGDAIYEVSFPGWGSSAGAWPDAPIVREWGTAVYGAPSKKTIRNGIEVGLTYGLYYDEATNRLYFSFGSANSITTNEVSLGYATLDEAGPVAYGAWNAPDAIANAQRIRGGSMLIPDWFAGSYLDGRTLGLGFGGAYASFTVCAKGTFLAAAFPPDNATAQLDAVQLIEHNASFSPTRWGTRDADYQDQTGLTPPIANGVGYWGLLDQTYGSTAWIDLPDEHGLLYISRMGHGSIRYNNGTPVADTLKTHWWVYDPADLASVITGAKQPWEPQPNSWIVNYDPPQFGGAETAGCAFDPQTRTLFVLAPRSYQQAGQYYPLVQGWRLTERRKAGDINGDGTVNVSDLMSLVTSWGAVRGGANYNSYADLNSDGYVNVGDLQLLVQDWFGGGAPPVLQVDRTQLRFAGWPGGPNPAPQSVMLRNSGTGSTHWTAAVRSPAPPWLSITNATGSDCDSFTVNVDRRGFPMGTFTAWIDVTDAGAQNSPQSVQVTLQGLLPEVDRQGYTLPDFGGQSMNYTFAMVGLTGEQVLMIWDGNASVYGDWNRNKVVDAVGEKRTSPASWPFTTLSGITAADGRYYDLGSYRDGGLLLRTTVTIPNWSTMCVFGTYNGGLSNVVSTWGGSLASAGVEWVGGRVTRLTPASRGSPYDALAGQSVSLAQYPCTEYGAIAYSAANYCPGYRPIWGPNMTLKLPSGDLVSKMTNFCACGGSITGTSVTIPATTPTGAYELSTNLAFDDTASPDYAYRDFWDRYQGYGGIVKGYVCVTNSGGLMPDLPVISGVRAFNSQGGQLKNPWVTVCFSTQTLTTGRIKYGQSSVEEKTAVFNRWYERDHEWSLWDLTPGATYQYQVIARDFAGREVQSPIGTFVAGP